MTIAWFLWLRRARAMRINFTQSKNLSPMEFSLSIFLCVNKKSFAFVLITFSYTLASLSRSHAPNFFLLALAQTKLSFISCVLAPLPLHCEREIFKLIAPSQWKQAAFIALSTNITFCAHSLRHHPDEGILTLTTKCKLSLNFIGEKLLTNCRLSAHRSRELRPQTD